MNLRRSIEEFVAFMKNIVLFRNKMCYVLSKIRSNYNNFIVIFKNIFLNKKDKVVIPLPENLIDRLK